MGSNEMITYDSPNKIYQVPLIVPTTVGWIFSATAFEKRNYLNRTFRVSAFSPPSVVEHEGTPIGPPYWACPPGSTRRNQLCITRNSLSSPRSKIVFFQPDGEISTDPTDGIFHDKKHHPFSVNMRKDLRVPEKVDNQWTAGDSTRIIVNNLESQENLTLNVPGIGIAVGLSLDYTSVLVIAMKKIHIVDNPFFT